MSDILFRQTETDEGKKTIAVFHPETGYEKIVPKSHPFFNEIVLALLDDPQDHEKIKGLVDPTIGISKALAEAFGGRVTADLHHVYLDGFEVQGGLGKAIADRLRAGNDWLRFVKFLVNLDANPSYKVQQNLWGWIERYGATITQDGWLAGYKGLKSDRTSVGTGPNNFIDGVLFGEPDKDYAVPYEVGTTVSKRRKDCDDGTATCSKGLHIGSYNYALTFGENRAKDTSSMGRSTFALVVFNPADVVAVEGDWKIRVCSLRVERFLDSTTDVLAVTPEIDTETVAYTPVPVVTDAEMEADDLEHLIAQDDAQDVEPEVEEEEADRAAREALDGSEHLTVEEANEEIAASVEDAQEPDEGVFVDTASIDLDPKATLTENAALNKVLAADLADTEQGHKAVARKWAHITTESSVRRYRKNNGIVVKGALKRVFS